MHFAVVALGWLGDTLLAENLCCNIKEKFPNAKVILIVSKKFEELGKIMSCDAYYAYDKDNKNKGISGIYWFAKDIKKEVKRIDFALITHTHERSIIFSKLLNAKKIVSMPLKGLTPINLLINRKQKRDMHALLSTYRGIYNAKLLEKIGITKLSLNTNITIPEEHISQTINKFGNVLQFSSDYIVLSTVGKRDWQDWDIQEVCSFVKKADIKLC